MVVRNSSILAIDVGGSALRWALAGPDSSVRMRGEAPPFSGQLLSPGAGEAARTSIAEVARRAGGAGRVVAGVTGLSTPSEEADLLAAMLAAAFTAVDVRVMSDIELATRALTRAGTSMLVYSGTGSIAACIDGAGRLVTAGGKGVLIDDAGGGYWIAVTALRSVLRAEDAHPGAGWATPLGRAFARRFGGSDWATVRRAFYGLDRGSIGRLALAATEAADSDPRAMDVLMAAGGELAALARLLLGRYPASEVLLAGRAASLHPVIESAMAGALTGTSLRRIDYDGVAAAIDVARTMR